MGRAGITTGKGTGGRYAFDPATARVTFSGGPWSGTVAKLEPHNDTWHLTPEQKHHGAYGGVGSWWWSLDSESSDARPPKRVVPSLEAMDPATHVFSAGELAALFDDNPIRMESYLRGRIVSVSGRINQIRPPCGMFCGGDFITFHKERADDSSLMFRGVSHVPLPLLVNLHKDAMVTLRGRFRDYHHIITFDLMEIVGSPNR